MSERIEQYPLACREKEEQYIFVGECDLNNEQTLYLERPIVLVNQSHQTNAAKTYTAFIFMYYIYTIIYNI